MAFWASGILCMGHVLFELISWLMGRAGFRDEGCR